MPTLRSLQLILVCFIILPTLSLANGQWQKRADYGSFGRHRAIGIGIANYVYCGTGHLNGTGFDTWYSDWWQYDPASNSWTQKSDYPGNNGNGDQDVVAIATESMGFVGLGQIDGTGFYKYDPQTNIWTQVSSPPPTGDFNNTHAFSIGQKGYFPSLFSTNFFEYDTDTDTWTQKSPIPFQTTYGIPTFAVGNKGYIKNGNDFYEYDPSTDLWTAKAPFPGIFPHRPKGFCQLNYGFFIGGFAGNPVALPWTWSRDVWRYDPATDAWLQLEDFPGTTRRWAITGKVGDRVYYGLGTNGTNFNDFWEFNSIAGIEEFELTNFKAYPSPAREFVEFSSSEVQNYTIEVYNMQGQIETKLSTINGKIRLERNQLKDGLYFYNVLVDGSLVHTDKIVFI